MVGREKSEFRSHRMPEDSATSRSSNMESMDGVTDSRDDHLKDQIKQEIVMEAAFGSFSKYGDPDIDPSIL